MGNITINIAPANGSHVNTLEQVDVIDAADEQVSVEQESVKSTNVIDSDQNDVEASAIKREIYIKSIAPNRLGAYGIIWGSESEKDLHDEFFTAKTRDLTSILEAMGKVPMIFDHGQDDSVMKSTPFAAVDYMESDEIGLWFEAQVQKHDMYKEYIKPLIDSQKLYPSSGTLPAAKRVSKSGEITRWPIIEMTATPTPAEYRMLDVPISEIKAAYKSIGVTLPDDVFKSDDDEPEAEKVVDSQREETVSKLLREFETLKINYYKFDLENYNDY